MRRDRKNGVPTLRAQPSEIVEVFQRRDFFSGNIQNDHIGAAQANFRRGNKQDPHCCGIREYFRSIKDSVVQRDRESPKTKCTSAVQQLVRRVIDCVLRIIQGVDMQIDLDPIALIHLIHAHARAHARISTNEILTADHIDFISS